MSRRFEAAMGEGLRLLAARKELLLARSRLHRMELVHETQTLRRSVARPATILSVALSAPVRPLLFGALLFVLGRGRLARVLRVAMGVAAAVKIVKGIQEASSSSASAPPVSTRTRP